MTYIGIDPGKTGAIALISNDTVVVFDMPLINKEINSLKIWYAFWPYPAKSIFCIIEKAQTMPKQGIVSAFNYGVGYGMIISALKILKIEYVEVRPSVWKKEFGLTRKGKVDSCDVADKLFPGQTLMTPRGRMLHGRAEALLLAEYGKKLKK